MGITNSSRSSELTSVLTRVLGVSLASDIAITYNFSTLTELPNEFTLTRASNGWYNDRDGYIRVASSNVARLGSIYDTDYGLLVEKAETANNLYSRPSSGVVGDHLSAGSSIASIVTDADNPCKDLASGTSVWELDNSGGGSPVNVEWDGSISSGKASAIAYIETVSGDDPTLSISGNGDQELGHTVAGYTLYRCEDRTVGGAENLRITVPAGAVVRVACVNFQSYDYCTSFIDTAGSSGTRAIDDVNSEMPYMAGLTECTVFYDFTFADDDGQTCHLMEIKGGGTDELITLWQSGGVARNTISSGGVSQVSSNTAAYFNRQRSRITVSIKEDEFRKCLNGFTEFTDTSGSVPDFDAVSVQPNALSFLALNRSGSAPSTGIVHGFTVYKTAKSETFCNNLTNPNTDDQLWITMFGDSNLFRWTDQYSNRPTERFVDNLGTKYNGEIFTVNKGDSSSAANFTGADAQGVDYWSDNGDSGGGTSWLQAIGPDGADGISIVEDTFYQKRKIDYVIINIAAGDIVSIYNGDIDKADYKTSMENILQITRDELGSQIKFILQRPPKSTNTNHTDAGTQAVREVYLELESENEDIIGSYDLYDVTLVDTVHPNEAGFNKATDRAANIILADLGLESITTQPELVSAAFGAEVVKLTFDQDIEGSDTSVFRILDDGSPVTISDIVINGNVLYILTSAEIVSTSTVSVTVGYGKMGSLVEANVFKSVSSALPLKSTDAVSVSYDINLDVEWVLDEGEFVVDEGEPVYVV